ncbi:hypothetical protein B566_EDAN004006 [Ephemera danica]|nr:hypothetical protein B566_EDAN004006 [Ephemera danica]
MPACARETVQWPLVLERARAGSSSSSSCSSSGSELGPGSLTADWVPSPESFVTRFLGWYPALVIRLTRQMLAVTLYLVWNQIFLSTGLWLVDCLLHVPLSIAKFVLSVLHGGRGRTVVITGSSVETLQIARNFYRSGARVVVVEHDENYGVVRFSTVVDKFYKVPSPLKYPQEYVRELCMIAERENAAYFVPTSTSHPAHYDALAKPYLEKIGVKCMCPGLKEVLLVDDPAAMFQLCKDAGLAIPIHNRVTTREQLSSLYEEGQLRRARHVLFNAGAIAVRDIQIELELPQTRRGYRRLLQTQPETLLNISVSRPALVVQIPEGERLVTCTTVREGRVVANVTCRAPLPEEKTPALVPLHRDDVEQWLESFIAAVPGNKSFTGHVSFTLIVTRNGIVPICSRLVMGML